MQKLNIHSKNVNTKKTENQCDRQHDILLPTDEDLENKIFLSDNFGATYQSSMHSSSPAGPIVTALARTKDAFAFHLCPIEGLMRSRSTFARTVTRQPKLKLSRAHSFVRSFVRSFVVVVSLAS